RDDRARGDHAVGIQLAGERIHDRLAEYSCSLRGRGNARERERLRDLPKSFVIGEKERAVADDRSAEHEPELVALKFWLHVVDRFEKADGIQRGVAVELPDR